MAALRRALAALVLMLAATVPSHAAIALAGVFGDHMVLQRGRPIAVWGRAAPGEVVRVTLAGTQASARADSSGRWRIALRARASGGPYDLTARGRDSQVRLRDVLVGDVWLASGQSNMEWTLAQSADAEREIAAADHPRIRHIKLPKLASLAPQDDIGPAEWHVSSPATAGDFSAVAYHFARRVQRDTAVPIGIVNASLGGSHIETWTSARAALDDPDLASIVQAMPRDDAAFAAAHRERGTAQMRRWQGEGRAGPGSEAPDLADADWPTLDAPGVWEEQGLPGFDGALWYRRRVTVDSTQALGAATLSPGAIDDCDDAWVDGVHVGRTCGWDTPRRYALPTGLLKPGANTIAVRVIDSGGGGGFHGAREAMFIETAAGAVPLAGPWHARIEAPLAKRAPDFNDLPTLLFNGMIAPIAPLGLRGLLWYQGESNVPRAAHYARAFPRLIRDWRAHFGQPRLPFLYVQLPSFLPLANNSLAGSTLAELREAQRMALALPATGMAVTTDVGDASDIHPRDKRSVGERLAQLALRKVYRRNVAAEGPVFRSLRVRADGRAELRFDDQGAGIAIRRGEPELGGFAIAGANGRFVAARAVIDAGRVLTWSDEVRKPVAVRYGWVDNPEQSNLVNGAGLPASPFRTDSAPWVTRAGRFVP